MRLIDADALKKKATMLAKELRPMVSSHCMGVTVWDIDATPTIDAVPVVRCMDCVMKYILGDEDVVCGRTGVDVDPDDFCSYGSRDE